MLFYWMWIDKLHEPLFPGEPLHMLCCGTGGETGEPGTGAQGGDRVCGPRRAIYIARGPRGQVHGSPGKESTVETGREGGGGVRKGGRGGSPGRGHGGGAREG